MILTLICILLWVYLLWVLKRAGLNFYRYLLGSVGLFVFFMILVRPVVMVPLTKSVAYVAGKFGEWTGLYDSYYKNSMLFIPKHTAAVSLYIDFDCSGVIEIAAYLSLLWFYNIYKRNEKILLSLFGIVYIFIANVIRIYVICVCIYIGGNDMYYFAHGILGRIIFYAFSITLYFYVFTKSQIVRQKVGGFQYNDANDQKTEDEKKNSTETEDEKKNSTETEDQKKNSTETE